MEQNRQEEKMIIKLNNQKQEGQVKQKKSRAEV